MSVRKHNNLGANNSLSMRRKNMAIAAQVPCPNNKTGVSTSLARGISCSTPEQREAGSPCDSDSEAASPVPFLCTQDGSYGDTEVVWNYYTPNRVRETRITAASTTPHSRRAKLKQKSKIGQLQQPKQKLLRETQRKPPHFQDLLQELNKNIQEIVEKTQKTINQKIESGSEEDMFCCSPEHSPNARVESFSRSRCLRKNLLSSKFSKPENEPALESDDSMNECLMRASQMIEEKVFCAKRHSADDCCDTSSKHFKIEHDSMDGVLSNVLMDSSDSCRDKIAAPVVDDSFDNFVGNLNDSAMERLTQLPIKNESPTDNDKWFNGKTGSFTNKNTEVELCDIPFVTSQANSTGWTIKELIAMDSRPTKSSFSRHSSMPESPSACPSARPSTSGTALSRHSSMPYNNERPAGSSSDDSTPIRCTQDEIKRKHQQAREKLLAKRLFPNTSSQRSQVSCTDTDLPVKKPQTAVKIQNGLCAARPQTAVKFPHELPAARPQATIKFQPKVPTRSAVRLQTVKVNQSASVPMSEIIEKSKDNNLETTNKSTNGLDLKSIIEKKRKEALLKLKMKRLQNNVP